MLVPFHPAQRRLPHRRRCLTVQDPHRFGTEHQFPVPVKYVNPRTQQAREHQTDHQSIACYIS